jgi:predicted hotdog family 3-hydroxylacyl-ACP dehydratase
LIKKRKKEKSIEKYYPKGKMVYTTENYPPIDSLIPHRDRMRLVEEIVGLTAEGAVTRSTVTSQWPLMYDMKVDPLVIIELVAQTSAIHVSWKKGAVHGQKGGGGLLVGVKEAEFFLDSISVGTVLTTSIRDMYSLDNYTVLEGIVCAESGNVGRVEIQVIRFH